MTDPSLAQIVKRVERLEGAVFGEHRASSKKKKTPGGTSDSPKTLPAHIVHLRDAGFFKKARTAKEAHTKLETTYPCDLDRVMMALMRLHRRKKLRKASRLVGKKKQTTYVW